MGKKRSGLKPPLVCVLKVVYNLAVIVECAGKSSIAFEEVAGCLECINRNMRRLSASGFRSLFNDAAARALGGRLQDSLASSISNHLMNLIKAYDRGIPEDMIEAAEEAKRFVEEVFMLAKIQDK